MRAREIDQYVSKSRGIGVPRPPKYQNNGPDYLLLGDSGILAGVSQLFHQAIGPEQAVGSTTASEECGDPRLLAPCLVKYSRPKKFSSLETRASKIPASQLRSCSKEAPGVAKGALRAIDPRGAVAKVEVPGSNNPNPTHPPAPKASNNKASRPKGLEEQASGFWDPMTSLEVLGDV